MNAIPPMTDPLGKYWEQPPDIRGALMDDTHVILRPDQLAGLHEYSTSIPTGVYPGKCWKRWGKGVWVLVWFGDVPSKPDQCSINWRTVLI
jgi:hypothetical protein